PLSQDSITEAVQLNGVGVRMNLAAFTWGRRAAADLAAVEAVIGVNNKPRAESLDDVIARRAAFLASYQDAAYAETYRSFVQKVRDARGGSEALTLAVARNLFKLMAYKDEYEVARLYADDSFAARLGKQFKGDYTLKFHLAPPILGRRDPFSGKPLKTEFGPWMMTAFRLLARMKGLRGTALDIFGRSAERRMERQLINDYRDTIARLLTRLEGADLATVVELANV
ncbi:MAG: indolepyruvate ferredoxin oxidoreductase family protein, partial [Alphaproteobacteria bacterium]|nr:indolepyruvate ferredoxin oxidoreductase family protein [Alphaproteobacteria bacterium]